MCRLSPVVRKPLLTISDVSAWRAKRGRQFKALDASLTWDDKRHASISHRTVRAFHARGETLTIVPIGALTNIALAFHLAPILYPSAEFVMMGGKWSDNFPEWNILCDPEPAAMVFKSGAEIRMVGLDVTLQCVLAEDEEALSPRHHSHTRVSGATDRIVGHAVTLHDPLTF
jgi:inosine-uridine nucleoside N-ribohydrolase